MEVVVMRSLFNGIYSGKTVLVTGHTGFKGSWLALWLKEMGADVIGYSLEAPSRPNHIELLDMDITSIHGDIRDVKRLDEVFERYRPDIVFHLAAQALVRDSYKDPVETYDTNVMGTLKVFEACRKHHAKAIVNITSDKAYKNREWVWGYRENDPLGGFDPYSSSKGCAELLTNSYRASYFNNCDYRKTHNTLLASCRAGNVIGGGDWGKERLISDIMTSASKGEKVAIRNPKAIRPWQFVLEPLSGYLLVGQKLLEADVTDATSFNFGPLDAENICVEEVAKTLSKHWNQVAYICRGNSEQLHEANLLKLDCSKAVAQLRWESVWDVQKTLKMTALWYRSFYEYNKTQTKSHLQEYLEDAVKKGVVWTRS